MTDHVDYPHYPGTLYDCVACEVECHCNDMGLCIYCAELGHFEEGDCNA